VHLDTAVLKCVNGLHQDLRRERQSRAMHLGAVAKRTMYRRIMFRKIRKQASSRKKLKFLLGESLCLQDGLRSPQHREMVSLFGLRELADSEISQGIIFSRTILIIL